MRADFVLVNKRHDTTEQIEVCLHNDHTLEIHRYRPDATDQLIATVSLTDLLTVVAGGPDIQGEASGSILITENPYPI